MALFSRALLFTSCSGEVRRGRNARDEVIRTAEQMSTDGGRRRSGVCAHPRVVAQGRQGRQRHARTLTRVRVRACVQVLQKLSEARGLLSPT